MSRKIMVIIQNSSYQNINKDEVNNREIRFLPDLSIFNLLSVYILGKSKQLIHPRQMLTMRSSLHLTPSSICRSHTNILLSSRASSSVNPSKNSQTVSLSTASLQNPVYVIISAFLSTASLIMEGWVTISTFYQQQACRRQGKL